ncbi:DNA gyrase subunit A [Paenibacillus sp. FSL M7-0831]|uniref:DNA gyrase subunit A n=1 Tax=Paenibacillus sp. FSL M7-0831 TaxID=2975314 RepID=UPI0030FB736C
MSSIRRCNPTFGINMLAIVKNEPKVLSLRDVLNYYLEHQVEVIRPADGIRFEKSRARAHILEGLRVALDHLDEVISIIRSSQTTDIARDRLIERFGLSNEQTQAILEMRLQRLTGLEREKIENEYQELMVKIAEYKEIFGQPAFGAGNHQQADRNQRTFRR